MKRIIVDLNVVTVAEWDKKKESIEFLEKARKYYEVYTPLTFLYRILRDWKHKKLADKVFRQYDIITHAFLQESRATIVSFEKLKLTLREFTDLIAKNLKIREEDAALVAYATLFEIDILVTYNRKDLRDREEDINNLLKKFNLKPIEIKLPEELASNPKSFLNIPKSFLSILPSFSLPFLSNLKSSFLSHNSKLLVRII